MPSILRKEISTVWLLPLSLIGLPFLLAALGRLFGTFGAIGSAEALVGLAQVYGNLPMFLLGFRSSAFEDTVFAYVVAGVLYSAVIFLIIVGGGLLRRQARRS